MKLKISEKRPLAKDNHPRSYNSADVESSGSYEYLHANNLGVSWPTSSVVIMNSALGAGLLTYPEVYYHLGGVISTTLIQIIVIGISMSTMCAICICSDLDDVDTYEEMLQLMCGRLVAWLGSFALMVTTFGICLTFLIIIGDICDYLFVALYGSDHSDHWYMDSDVVVIVVVIVLIWPLSCGQRVAHVKFSSYLGLFSSLYLVFTIVRQFFKMDPQYKSVNHLPDGLNSFLTSLPIVVFSYQTHINLIPIYGSLRDRNPENLLKSSAFSMIVMFLIYVTIGIFGYLSLSHRNAHDELLSMYDPNDPIVTIAMVLIIIKFIATYPQMIVSGRQSCNVVMGKDLDRIGPIERYVTTGIINLFILYLALTTSDLTDTIRIVGSLTAITSYLLPGVCLSILTTSPSITALWSGTSRTIVFAFGLFLVLLGALLFLIILLDI